MPLLKALVFDAYGTLYDVHSVAAQCEAFFPGKGAQLSQLWRSKQLEYTWQRSLMNRYQDFEQITRAALTYSGEALGLQLNADKIDALLTAYRHLTPYPEVPAALSRFSLPLAILSNGSPAMLRTLVENSALADYFSVLLSIDALGIYKPAPQVYRLATDYFACLPAEIGFVSSNCWDALGAKSFGCTVYWINRAAAPLDRLDFVPDRIITYLDQLPSLLPE